jgi:hypothetical protein
LWSNRRVDLLVHNAVVDALKPAIAPVLVCLMFA